MSIYIITKSKAQDFNGNWNQDNLSNEIIANPVLSTIFKGVEYSVSFPDVISIIFTTEPDIDGMTILNNIILNHNPVRVPPRVQFTNGNARVPKINSHNYYLILTINYPGCLKRMTIDYIDITAHCDEDTTSYSLKVIDSISMKTIAEKTSITNKVKQVIDLGTIQNMPPAGSILEVYAKRTSNNPESYVYVDDVVVYYGN